MEVNNKRRITLTIIGVATLLILVLSATFAYFSAQTSNDKGTTNVTASTEKVGSIALSNPTGDLHLNLSVSDMAQDNLNTYWATDNESKNYDSEEVQREIAVAELSGGSATAKYECTTTISVELSGSMVENLTPEDAYIQFGGLLTDKVDLTSVSADGYLVTFNLDGTNIKRQAVTAAVAIENRNADQSYLAGKELGITFSNSDLECQVVGSSKYKGSKLSEAIMAMSEEDGSGVYHETGTTTVPGTYSAIPASESDWASINLTGDGEFTGDGDNGVWTLDYASFELECTEWAEEEVETEGDCIEEDADGECIDWEIITVTEEVCQNYTSFSTELILTPNEDGYYQFSDESTYPTNIKWLGIEIYVDNVEITNYTAYYYSSSNRKNYNKTTYLGYLTTNNEIKIKFTGAENVEDQIVNFSFMKSDAQFVEVDAGYRYEGMNVNNYVTFNDELWRIISVEEGSAIGLEEGTYYTKIIRSESLEEAPYIEYDFGIDLISDILNDAYYNKTMINCDTEAFDCGCEIYDENGEVDSVCQTMRDYTNIGLNNESREMLVKADWYYSDFWLEDLSTSLSAYVVERYIAGTASKDYVGLMTSSDYGYAALQSECKDTLLTNYSSCTSNNWLYSGVDEWLLSWDMVYEEGEHLLIQEGNVTFYYANGYDSYPYRPVVYLSKDVVITNNGTGEIDNPYELSM